MKHYGIAQWVDFVRGLVPETTGLMMRNHLADGCSRCREDAEFCQNLQNISTQMGSYTAPEWVVRRAKAIFPVAAEPERKRTRLIPIQLIYDSFSLPAAGLRSSWQVGWQALYRAGDCSLDLRIEPEPASARAAVIGQLSNHTRPAEKMERIPVCLKSGKLVVAETRSNRFGEFLMEYEQAGRVQLCVYLDGGSSRIQVPLKKLACARAIGATEPDLGVVDQASVRHFRQKPKR